MKLWAYFIDCTHTHTHTQMSVDICNNPMVLEVRKYKTNSRKSRNI